MADGFTTAPTPRDPSTADSGESDGGIVGGPHTRLAVYGSLAPGRSNHGQLSGLTGEWVQGSIRGKVVEIDRGPDAGYPGLILDHEGPEVDVLVLVSAELPGHWSRIDDFEGPCYERVVVDVVTANGTVAANVYILAPAWWP